MGGRAAIFFSCTWLAVHAMLAAPIGPRGQPILPIPRHLKYFPGFLSFDNAFAVALMLSHEKSDNLDGFASRLSPCTALLLSSHLRAWLDGVVLSPVADT